MDTPYLTEQEVAAYLKLERQTLTRWRWEGKGPQFFKIGNKGAVRYRLKDVEAYIQPGARS